MLHRGLQNNTKKTRYALYIGYYVESYTVKETENL